MKLIKPTQTPYPTTTKNTVQCKCTLQQCTSCMAQNSIYIAIKTTAQIPIMEITPLNNTIFFSFFLTVEFSLTKLKLLFYVKEG